MGHADNLMRHHCYYHSYLTREETEALSMKEAGKSHTVSDEAEVAAVEDWRK
jgi:hypothetical protein